jgi:membrane-associated phospholipid phosphatase
LRPGEGSPALAALRWGWITYCACVLLIAGLTRAVDARVNIGAFATLHALALALACCLHPNRRHSRLGWAMFTAAGLPAVFSAVGFVLPALHPQPYEWACIAIDRRLFGCDPTVAVQGLLSPWLVEAMQLAYATFYFLPVVVLLTLLAQRRVAEFDAGLCIVGCGFLLSYLGYYLFPTLPPYRYLDHGAPLQGLLLAERVHGWLDALEANRFDCMPSGHTMMTLVTLVMAWRHTRRLFWGLLPITILLLCATVALRYHYVVDLLAGTALAPVAFWVARALTRACA